MPYAYKAPLHDLRFVIEQVLDAPASWSTCSAFAELDLETTQAVLDEAARFASQVLLPINASGDTEGCRLRDGHVCTPRGYREAYRAFVASARAALGVDDRAWARAKTERMRHGVQWLLPQADVHWPRVMARDQALPVSAASM